MNESEMDSPPPTELTDQIAALRRQMITLLLALIVVSGTLTVYLWYQSRITGKEIDAIRPQAMQMMQMFNQRSLVVEKLFRNCCLWADASGLPAHSEKIRNPVDQSRRRQSGG